jgi:pre-mRNA-splicing factor CWC22
MGTDELRSTGELFGHLLANDAVAWRSMLGLDGVRITEEDTTSSSRIFIKTMFQETAEQLGVRELGRRLNDGDSVVRDAILFLFTRSCSASAYEIGN